MDIDRIAMSGCVLTIWVMIAMLVKSDDVLQYKIDADVSRWRYMTVSLALSCFPARRFNILLDIVSSRSRNLLLFNIVKARKHFSYLCWIMNKLNNNRKGDGDGGDDSVNNLVAYPSRVWGAVREKQSPTLWIDPLQLHPWSGRTVK